MFKYEEPTGKCVKQMLMGSFIFSEITFKEVIIKKEKIQGKIEQNRAFYDKY